MNVPKVAPAYAGPVKVVSINAPDGFRADARDVRRALAWVLPSMSQDETRAHLHALRIEWHDPHTVRVVATDGQRLAWADVAAECPRAFAVVLQGPAVRAFVRIVREAGKGRVTLDEGGMLTSDAGACTLATQDAFPPWRAVVPHETAMVATAHVETRALQDAIATLDKRAPRGKGSRTYGALRFAGAWTLVEESERAFTPRDVPLASIYSHAPGDVDHQFSSDYVRGLASAARAAGIEALALRFNRDPTGPMLAAPLDVDAKGWGFILMPMRR